MTVALAILFVGIMLIWTAVAGRSLKHAFMGRSVPGGGGKILKP